MTTTAEPATGRSARPSRGQRPSWPLVTTLITFGLLPIAGSRLAALAAGQVSATNGDVLGGPIPILVHVIGATVFVVLGAFQFAPRLRRRRPQWHRRAGRIVFGAGMAAALSGLWISQFGERHGDLLYLFRLLAGLAMITSLALGLRAILRRNIPVHRAWMIRAYAIGLGASSQLFALGFGKPIFGDTELNVAFLNLAGWVVNLAIAQLIIVRGRRSSRGAKRPRGSVTDALRPS